MQAVGIQAGQLHQSITFDLGPLFIMHGYHSRDDIRLFLKQLFPALKTAYIDSDHNELIYFGRGPYCSIDDGIVIVRTTYRERYALISPFAFSVNDLDVQFLLMFILGNLVRYVPHKWTNVASFVNTDEFFLLEGFIESSSLIFPNLILNELEGRDYEFLTHRPGLFG